MAIQDRTSVTACIMDKLTGPAENKPGFTKVTYNPLKDDKGTEMLPTASQVLRSIFIIGFSNSAVNRFYIINYLHRSMLRFLWLCIRKKALDKMLMYFLVFTNRYTKLLLPYVH